MDFPTADEMTKATTPKKIDPALFRREEIRRLHGCLIAAKETKKKCIAFDTLAPTYVTGFLTERGFKVSRDSDSIFPLLHISWD